MGSWTQATQGMNDRKLCWTVSQMLKDVRFGAENDQALTFPTKIGEISIVFCKVKTFVFENFSDIFLKLGHFETFLALGFNYFRHL